MLTPLLFVAALNCSVTQPCPGRHVYCDFQDFQCLCDEAYATCQCDVLRNPCCYAKKSQLTAFMLSFFLGSTGADRFYLNLLPSAIGKLFFMLIIPCILPCLLMCILGRDPCFNCLDEHFGKCACAIHFLYCSYSLGFMIWWLYDVIQIGLNNLPDAQNVSLAPW